MPSEAKKKSSEWKDPIIRREGDPHRRAKANADVAQVSCSSIHEHLRVDEYVGLKNQFSSIYCLIYFNLFLRFSFLLVLYLFTVLTQTYLYYCVVGLLKAEYRTCKKRYRC